MSKVVKFPEQNMDDYALEIPRSEEFIEIAEKLGAMIKSLPLDHKQNDDLVYLMVEQVTEAENNAFRFGIKIASKFNDYLGENNEK